MSQVKTTSCFTFKVWHPRCVSFIMCIAFIIHKILMNKGTITGTLSVCYLSHLKAPNTTVFLINSFIPEAEEYCPGNNIIFNILLMEDNAPGHPAHVNDCHLRVAPSFFSPNTTVLHQPMEQGFIANFKPYQISRSAQAVEETDNGQNCHDFWKYCEVQQAIRSIP